MGDSSLSLRMTGNVILSVDPQRWASEISPNGRYATVWLYVFETGDSSKASQVGPSQNDEATRGILRFAQNDEMYSE